MNKKLLVLLITACIGISLQGCARTKSTLAGAAIGGLAGNASKGAQIGATAGLLVDIFD